MLFTIEPTSSTPIYRQLIDQIQRMIASGQLKPGEQMPSVRQVAESLAVNPMTVSKAYSQLEQQDVLIRQRGKGMLVRERQTDAAPTELLSPALEALCRQARELRLDEQALVDLVKTHWEKHNG